MDDNMMNAPHRDPQLGDHGLVRWAPNPPPDGPRTVADVLGELPVTDPDRLALIDETTTLSYGELDGVVNQTAHCLLAEGLQPGDRLAVSLPNAAPIVVLFLAAMRIGVIWVGINRILTSTEKRYIVEDCEPRLLICHEELAVPHEWAPSVRVSSTHADRLWGELREHPRSRPDVTIDPFGPAAIAYTSGTTGAPKGAVHSQHNMLLPGVVTRRDGTITPSSRQGVVLPLTILNLQILGPVAAFVGGATCVVMDRIDPCGLAERVRRDQVERIAVPPTTAYDLLTHPDVAPDDLASLSQLFVGGAGAPPGLGERYRSRFGRMFQTTYGLTEAPTAVAVDTRDERPARSSGLPLPHAQILIVDAADHPVRAGEEGEICVAPRDDGPFAGVYSPMLGYWNRPDVTTDALRGGWLHTGDRGWLEPDGSLVVIGRGNELILRGGANVYPAEVEQALLTHPDVAEAAVIGRPDERLGETVVAAIRLRDGATPDQTSLQSLCSDKLAKYKIPTEFHFVADLPRNSMNKVVKSQLREQLFGDAHTSFVG